MAARGGRKIALFDVDGTLTQPRKVADACTLAFLQELRKARARGSSDVDRLDVLLTRRHGAGGGRGHRRRIGCGEDRRAAGRQCGARLRLRVFGERADGAQGRQAAGQAELAHAPRRSEASSADQLHLALRRRLGHPHQARDVRGVSKRDVERVAHRQELQPRRTRRVRSVRQGCARACQDGASAPTEVPRLRLDVFHRWTNQLRCVPTWMGQNLLLEVLGRVRRNPLLRGQDVSGRERLRNLRLGTDPWTHRDVARRHRRPSQRNLLVINGRSQ
mmetsp:Transcript_2251/g.14933  ORF Transcript_2251/g.14933 Transcript_2251/m.14933 type:complete len:275 (+) Transcript_2251:927-1751(+)